MGEVPLYSNSLSLVLARAMMDRNSKPPSHQQVLQGDVTSAADVTKAFEAGDVDQVVIALGGARPSPRS